jgi:putative phage-type endonuclease
MDEITQRSEEWTELRKGKFTSSQISNLLGQSLETETAQSYILDRLAERLGVVQDKDRFVANSLQWGIDNEPLAKKWVNELVMPFQSSYFQLYEQGGQVWDYYGGSPDGQNDTHILEIKCPYNTVQHLKNFDIKDSKTFKKRSKDYYWQVQSNMLIAKKELAYFVSFDPRIDGKIGLYAVEIEIDIFDTKLILERVEEAEHILQQKLNDILEVYEPKEVRNG